MTKATGAMYLENVNDIATPSGNAIFNLTAGERVWCAVQSSGAQTITCLVRNVSIA